MSIFKNPVTTSMGLTSSDKGIKRGFLKHSRALLTHVILLQNKMFENTSEYSAV